MQNYQDDSYPRNRSKSDRGGEIENIQKRFAGRGYAGGGFENVKNKKHKPVETLHCNVFLVKGILQTSAQ